MSGTIVRYDGSGAVAPDNLQARARPPPTAAAGAPTTRKRPCAQAAADGRLLRAVPRPAGTAKGMHPRDLSRLMQAFMWPAIPGAKWMDILVRSLTGSEDACAVFLENDSPTGGPPFTPPAPFRRPWRRTESPSLSAPSGVASLAPRLPTGTRAMPSATSCLTRRRPAASHQRTMWSSAAGAAARRRTPTLSPRCAPSQRCHRLRVGSLPDRYAQAAKVSRVIGIITRQMSAIRLLIWSRWDALPWAGGWQLLAAPKPPH